MCGICGIFNFDRRHLVSRETLRTVNNTIFHRGPDDEGLYASENVGLAMRRLSIIDLQTGKQPVTNEDKTAFLVYNGEIYNHRELRGRLEALGHRFYTHTDTEVIVHLYEEYGRDCVQHLRGMFAFLLWDSRRRVLFGARDRFGIKPFYYLHTAERFVCASEIKAILACPMVFAGELNVRMQFLNTLPLATSPVRRRFFRESGSSHLAIRSRSRKAAKCTASAIGS